MYQHITMIIIIHVELVGCYRREDSLKGLKTKALLVKRYAQCIDCLTVIAFSRNERTHPNLVSQASQAREIEIFVDCKLAAPVGFCRGFGPRFRVHLSRHACSLLWLLSLFSTFWGFL